MEINIGAVQRLASPAPFGLVSVRTPEGKTNLTAVSWWTFASNHPPLVAVCLSKKGLSGELIAQDGEFGLSLVDESLRDAAYACGTCSGRKVDKPEQFGIELREPKLITAPLVERAKVAMECRLESVTDASDHNLFLARIVAVHCREELNHLYAWEGYKRLESIHR